MCSATEIYPFRNPTSRSHHVDLISGEVTGIVDPNDTDAYANDVNPTTQVVATYTKKQLGQRYVIATYEPEADTDRYFRLRGTNMPDGVPFETDDAGNPLADSEANDNIYANIGPRSTRGGARPHHDRQHDEQAR